MKCTFASHQDSHSVPLHVNFPKRGEIFLFCTFPKYAAKQQSNVPCRKGKAFS